MRYLFFLFASFSIFSTNAQTEGLNINGRISDGISGEPLPYVTLIQLKTKRGTISNSDGYFSFENLVVGDSIQFSFIGYQNFIFIATEGNDLDIKLMPEINLLNAVTILYNTDFLNELIQKCRKTKNNRSKIAKTYFSLASYYQNQRVEMLEAYYNGHFVGHDVRNLDLKNGRIALLEKENRFFISSETSVALCRYCNCGYFCGNVFGR